MINSNLNTKLLLLLKLFLIYLLICLKSYADDSGLRNSMVVIGSNNAVVKIKVFSSLTCPHCANFHINVVSEIKKIMLILVKFS